MAETASPESAAIRHDARDGSRKRTLIVSGVARSGTSMVARMLLIDRFTGVTKDSGNVNGHAAFDFAGAHGLGMDIAIDAHHALPVVVPAMPAGAVSDPAEMLLFGVASVRRPQSGSGARGAAAMASAV